ncbi:hypothetical protein NLI96_g534 [Meripilus lineatus]|uniref:26S proteasome regulatory subunit 6A n=1 Tax=Meripilus lineatus TaxID=2056292 RepID=A0AAD5VC53_9APHY|nr:hypothetical protein NLI96_g534 [Physisporinus lineatus]
MASAQPPNMPPAGGNNNEKNPEKAPASASRAQGQDSEMDTTPDKPAEETWDDIPDDIKSLSTDEIFTRIRLLDNDIKVMRSETLRLGHEQSVMKEKIRDNGEKIKQNKVLPYLVGNVVEILDVDPEGEEDGANRDLDSMRKGKCAVIKTSTRQTVFLPLIGLVPADKLKPGDLIGVNKDSYLVLDTLPAEFDSRVKAMEVDERPTETYTDIGGLEKQIEELVEAIVLPMEQADKFKTLGIKPPKGCLMYGPPGTGKTLLARACAAQTKACYLKLAGPSLVQMFIGDGAKLVRDAFELAKLKAPAIIFIDELDAIGTKRFDSEKSGDREVQRTMLELLNQLDGFSSDDRIKVIAATNRIDILDPALLRSGRLDRKIEFPLPNETARARILEIHSRKMTVGPDVNYDELARSTDEFNAAQLKAVCVEAGMIALREGATKLGHEHFLSGIAEGSKESSVAEVSSYDNGDHRVAWALGPSVVPSHGLTVRKAPAQAILKTLSYAQTDPQPGSILTPRPGTKILPGAQFNFSYFGRADYGVSSYNYHVWLLGDQVSSDGFMGGLGGSSGGKDSYIHGWYFGRFDYQNWPAVPYPKNPAPTQLTMPDFSKDQGGWGAGKAGSNVKFNLVVYEEYDDEFVSSSYRFQLHDVCLFTSDGLM